MGTLTPGATYIYERNGEEIYAREVGVPVQSRKLVGYQIPKRKRSKNTRRPAAIRTYKRR